MSSTCGESPPRHRGRFFGRDDLIEKVVDLAENLTPVALIGPADWKNIGCSDRASQSSHQETGLAKSWFMRLRRVLPFPRPLP